MAAGVVEAVETRNRERLEKLRAAGVAVVARELWRGLTPTIFLLRWLSRLGLGRQVELAPPRVPGLWAVSAGTRPLELGCWQVAAEGVKEE